MTRTGLAAVAAIIVLATAALAHAQTFSRVEFYPEIRLDYILVVADLNADGRDDIVAGGREERDTSVDDRPEGRHDTSALEVFVGLEDGTFRHAPELVDGAIEVRRPFVVAADFNDDEQIDLAVFDAGVFVVEESVGYGNPPQLWLSGNDGVLRFSETLAEAVRAEHVLRPPAGKGLSAPADLCIKTAVAGDIDNDGDLDLALGHLRGTRPERATSVSMVAVNDGTGHYPRRIELPHPGFNAGYTAVQFMTRFDFNGDGFEDLLLVHAREEGPEGLPSYTGRYLQALINDGGESFVDETPTWFDDQGLTAQVHYADGNLLYNFAAPRMLDVDRDGCRDIVMAKAFNPIRPEAPIFYLNNGSGRFRPFTPDAMFIDMGWDGKYAMPADVNGDGVIDLVFPQRILGADDEYGTEDDSTRLLTLLNTTPARPLRCRPRVTTVGTLPARTLHVGDGAVAEG